MQQPLFDIPCIILCGGKSSRMGEDKALLPFAGYDTLVEYQYKRLQPYFKDIYLSSKVNKFNFTDENSPTKSPSIIYDDSDVHSPIMALKTILDSIVLNKAFILTVDTPFVTIDTISQLITQSTNYDITVAKSERLHNLCGVFNKSCLSYINIMTSNNSHRIGLLLENSKTNIITFSDDNEFLNLNKKEDYLQALSIIS